MSELDVTMDLIKAEQGMWFVQSDLKNVIEKLQANNANKNEIMRYKKLHEQTVKLATDIKIMNIEKQNKAVEVIA